MFAQPTPPTTNDVLAALAACTRLATFAQVALAEQQQQQLNQPELELELELEPEQQDQPAVQPETSKKKKQLDVPKVLAQTKEDVQRDVFKVAQFIMKSLVANGDIPGARIYAAYIKVCAHCDQIDAAFQVVKDMKQNGVIPTMEIYKDLVLASARQGDLDRALDTVHNTVNTASSLSRHATWLRLGLRLAVGIEAGKWAGMALGMLTGMNEVATTILGVGFGAVFGIRLGVVMLLPPLQDQKFSWSKLIDSVNSASERQLDVTIPRDNAPLRLNKLKADTMSFDSLTPRQVSQYMLAYLVNVLESTGDINAALQVLRHMESKGIPATLLTYNLLVNDLVQQQRIDAAVKVVEHMPRDVKPNAMTVLPILEYHHQEGRHDKVIDTYHSLVKPRGIVPEVRLYTTLMSSVGKRGNIEEARSLFDAFLKDGFMPTTYVLNTLLGVYGKAGHYADAENVVYMLMPRYGVKPTVRTFSKLIDTARYLPVDTYVPPAESLTDMLALEPLPVFDPESVSLTARRAWYWYCRMRMSGVPMGDQVGYCTIMNVLNKERLYTVSLVVYRQVIADLSDAIDKQVRSPSSSGTAAPSSAPLSELITGNQKTKREHQPTEDIVRGQYVAPPLIPVAVDQVSPKTPLPLPGLLSYYECLYACCNIATFSLRDIFPLLYEMDARVFTSFYMLDPDPHRPTLPTTLAKRPSLAQVAGTIGLHPPLKYRMYVCGIIMEQLLKKCMRADTLPRYNQWTGEFRLVTLHQPDPDVAPRLVRSVISTQQAAAQLRDIQQVLRLAHRHLSFSLRYISSSDDYQFDAEASAEKDEDGDDDSLERILSGGRPRTPETPNAATAKGKTTFSLANTSGIEGGQDDDDDAVYVFTETDFRSSTRANTGKAAASSSRPKQKRPPTTAAAAATTSNSDQNGNDPNTAAAADPDDTAETGRPSEESPAARDRYSMLPGLDVVEYACSDLRKRIGWREALGDKFNVPNRAAAALRRKRLTPSESPWITYNKIIQRK
ncbi:hypothetical protein RI367_004438 [Sorochytrium milnesiophthora]